MKYYPNASHGFDVPLNRTVGAAGKTDHLAYDPAEAAGAEVRPKAFFDKLLR